MYDVKMFLVQIRWRAGVWNVCRHVILAFSIWKDEVPVACIHVSCVGTRCIHFPLYLRLPEDDDLSPKRVAGFKFMYEV